MTRSAADKISPEPAESAAEAPSQQSRHSLYIVILIAATLLAYCNAFKGEFILDDNTTIVGNEHLTRLWPLSHSMSAPPRTTNSGRPVACLALALNHQVSGMSVAGFRAGNLLVHLLAGLALYGVLRRTLLNGRNIPARLRDAADGLACATALVWLVHPLNSMLVNYSAQRCESLNALFFLLTLYCAIRGWQSARRAGWFAAAVVLCAAAMGSKEVMVAAPVLVLLYERTFVTGAIAPALRQSWPLYVGLCGTWGLLAWLVAAGGTSVGAQHGRLPHTASEYFLSQPAVILHYLRQTFLPYGLCFDYGWKAAKSVGVALPYVLPVTALGLATLWAVARKPALGFLGVCFFAILGPSSSIVPLPDIVFEYRFYLPMAAVLVAVVAGIWIAAGHFSVNARTMAGVVALLAVTCGALTLQRNVAYHSAMSLWLDTVKKEPQNARAHAGVGIALMGVGDLPRALQAISRAVELDPNNSAIQTNLGGVLALLGRRDEALVHFRRAVELAPLDSTNHYNLANALSELGRTDEALPAYAEAVRLYPEFLDAHFNYGIELFNRREYAAAETQFRKALALNYSHLDVRLMLARTMVAAGRRDDAAALLRETLKFSPGFAPAQKFLDSLN